MPAVVHGRGERRCLAAAEVADADGRVGAVCDGECAGVGRAELAGRRAAGVLGVEEDGARSGELVGDAQLGRRGVRGGGRGRSGGGGGWWCRGGGGGGKRYSVPGAL